MSEILGITNVFQDILQGMSVQECALYDDEIACAEAKQVQAEKQRLYEKTVPHRYWSVSLDTFVQDTSERKKMHTQAVNYVQKIKAREVANLILLGSAGTGKTHIACSILRECGGTYATSESVSNAFREVRAFSAKRTEADVTDFYASRSLLVIDEVGRAQDAAFEQFALYQVLNARYNENRATILVSNLNTGEFLSYIGTASADRVTADFMLFECKGESYRGQRHTECTTKQFSVVG